MFWQWKAYLLRMKVYKCANEFFKRSSNSKFLGITQNRLKGMTIVYVCWEQQQCQRQIIFQTMLQQFYGLLHTVVHQLVGHSQPCRYFLALQALYAIEHKRFAISFRQGCQSSLNALLQFFKAEGLFIIKRSFISWQKRSSARCMASSLANLFNTRW